MMQAVNESFEWLMAIGDRSKNGVFVFSLAKRRFLYVNQLFARIFGADRADLLQDARRVLSYILSEDHHYLSTRMTELEEKGSINGAELKLTTTGSMNLHLYLDAYLVDDNRIVTGFVKDVTKEKEHEDFLVDISAQKDSFLDMITHNLSGPLMLSQNLLSWMQRSLEDGKTPKDVSALLVMLQESTQECTDIVEDFLNEEHKDSCGIFVRISRFSLVEKVNTVLSKLQELTPDKEFTFNVNTTETYINTDSVKFFQIIHNLISNAIKFTDPGGHIIINVDADKEHFIFSVADNGIGIPDHLKPHVFDKKSIAGRHGLQGERSHGIGLSIIKKLAEVIGGKLWFESREGEGSTFYLELPKE